jgi:3-isopropylmalate dehydrogenase
MHDTGPEVTEQAVRALELVSASSPDFDLKLETHLFGGCAIDAVGEPLPESTLKACQEADAILMGNTFIQQAYSSWRRTGSIGGPKWGVDAKVRPEPGLLKLRKTLGLYANIRPANLASESLLEYSPLRPEIAKGVNLIVVRELIGGVYFGKRKEQGVAPDVDTAWDTMIYSVEEVQRITRVAAQIAMTTNPPMDIHSIDKANVLATSRLWRKVVTETLTKEYPQIKLHHQLVDSAAMFITSNPRKLNGVILTENLFGDMSVSFSCPREFKTKVLITDSQIKVVSFQAHLAFSLLPPLQVHRPCLPPISNPLLGSMNQFTAQHPTSLVRVSPIPLARSSALQCCCGIR